MCWHETIMRLGFARVNSTTTLESFVVLEYCLASGLNREQRFHRRSALARIHVPDDLALLGAREALPQIVGEIDVGPARLVRVAADAKPDPIDNADGEADGVAGQFRRVEHSTHRLPVNVVDVAARRERVALHEVTPLDESGLDGDVGREGRRVIVAVGPKAHLRPIRCGSAGRGKLNSQ